MNTAYSQKDPRWADIRLGTSRATIGSYGCLLCSVAGVLAYFGVDTDPGRLNRWLIANNGYVQGNLFVFGSVEGLGVSLVDLIDCSRKPAPIHSIKDALAANMGVVVKVDMSPGGSINQHWVRITEIEDDDARIIDPWMPDDYNDYYMDYYLLPRYGAPGWTLERAIFRIAIYAKSESVGSSAFVDLAEHSPPLLSKIRKKLIRRI